MASTQPNPQSIPPTSALSELSLDSSQSSSCSSDKKGAERWRWDDEKDLQLVRIVLAEEVWAAPYGSKDAAWAPVAERFRTARLGKDPVTPSERTCKEHYAKLFDERKSLDANPAVRSGSSESYTELDELLTQCVQATAAWVKKCAEHKAQVHERKKEVESTQQRVRTHALQTITQRRSRDASSTPSSMSSPTTSSSSSDVESAGHPKRQKPSLKIQQEALDVQKAASKLLGEQLERLVTATVNDTESKRSNDLFERWLSKQ